MEPELRSVLIRYSFVAVVLAGSVIWAVTYTTRNAAGEANGAPIVVADEAAKATRANEAAASTSEAAGSGAARLEPPATKAPSLASMFVERNGARRVACEPACRLEAYCGLRDKAACLKTSCDGDVRIASTSDFPFAGSEDCGQAALAPCEESCWRRGECTGDHLDDKRCTAACKTLASQRPAETFREARCVLESRCGDLAICGGVER